ncbi:MAG: phosphoribosylglycinamide formyltransferase [Ignavibacteriales bacterium]|nr:phosphoribosylglycinamide formyltransferase [Ignavibacteriales bacterium]
MNIAVFASGRGSNFQAILNAIDHGVLPARVTLVVSNKAEAGALEIARSRNIPAAHISQQAFPAEDSYVAQLLELLVKHEADIIALAGYLKRIPSAVVGKFRNRILNVHPALLPAFGGAGMYGMHVHQAVIQSGVKVSGATVHVVDEEYDRGPIVLQKTVEVVQSDTPESLASKVLKVEHEIYPLALKAFAEGRVNIEGRRIWIQP